MIGLDIKQDFPALFGKEIAFFDTAASAQKPQCVIDAMQNVMCNHYANIHRGLYEYSQKTTQEFENVRQKIAAFIHVSSENEIIFTRNATEAINLVAQSWGMANLQAGDEIILTEMEHHANIVPWQLLRDKIGVKIKVIATDDHGDLDLNSLQSCLSNRTRLVTYTHTSNVLGSVNSVIKINKIIKDFNPEIKILVDGSQAVVHSKINLQTINCDFFVFTGHKLYGPCGVGVLWGKYDILSAMPPYQGGGDMIETVAFDKTTYKTPPSRFEAGTPPIIDVIGFGAAIDYLNDLDMPNVTAHENAVMNAVIDVLESHKNIRIMGNPRHRAPILSFTMQGVHHSDLAMVLAQCNVAVRTGHHCCMPLMQRLGVDGLVRISVGIYNDMDDVERLMWGLDKAKALLT